MDLLDLLWNHRQDQSIEDLRAKVQTARTDDDFAGDRMRRLAEENFELKLRLGLLVRLLISKGVFTAQEFAALVAEARVDDAGRGE